VPCEAIKGIIREGDEVARSLLARRAGCRSDRGSQAVEHYEIARYGALASWPTSSSWTMSSTSLGHWNEEKATDATDDLGGKLRNVVADEEEE